MFERSWIPCAALVLGGSLACAGAPLVPVKDPAGGIELLPVKGGCFKMGNSRSVGGPNEKPVHEVCVDDFFMGKYEVTQGQWKAVMGANPSKSPDCGDNCPVDNVSWDDAQAFVAKLNGAAGGKGTGGRVYRLPTEAEWEYAARAAGTTNTWFAGSDVPEAVAVTDIDATALNAIGQRGPNALGIYDLSGGVWEWTADWYDEGYYAASPRRNPVGPASGERRVLRGGSYLNQPYEARVTFRAAVRPDYRGAGKGLRVVWGVAREVPRATSPASAGGAKPGAPATPSAPPVRDPATGMELVFVKGGCFRMGNIYSEEKDAFATMNGWGVKEDEGSELPVHEVCLDDYYIGRTEVTQAQWIALMGDAWVTEHRDLDKDLCYAPDCPLGVDSWPQLQEFIARMNKRGEGTFRLPTEAEWEYAARSRGGNDRYAGGEDLESVAWFIANSGYYQSFENVVHPVATKAPNGLGLYDMSGNLWELTGDWWAADYYARSPRDNPTGPETGTIRVKRGGCATGSTANLRTARRSRWGGEAIGFRLVWVPPRGARPSSP